MFERLFGKAIEVAAWILAIYVTIKFIAKLEGMRKAGSSASKNESK